MNTVNLIGFLATTPKTTGTTTTFLLAVHRAYKSRDGVDADFIPVVVFGKLSEVITQYTHKGSHMGLTGAIKTSTYQDKDGTTKHGWQVVGSQVFLLDSKGTHADTHQDKPDPYAAYVKRQDYAADKDAAIKSVEEQVNAAVDHLQATPGTKQGTGNETVDKLLDDAGVLGLLNESAPKAYGKNIG